MSKVKLPTDLNLTGHQPTILLLHAYSGSTADVTLLAHALNRAGYQVVSFNFWGHGTLSAKNILTRGSAEKWFIQTRKEVAKLRAQVGNQLYVFGLSLGGIYALGMLEEFPDLLGGGVFASPIFDDSNELFQKLETTFTAYAKQIQQFDETRTLSEKETELQYITAHLPKQLTEIKTLQDYVKERLTQIQAPVFIGQGTADEIIDSTKASVLANNLPNSAGVTLHWYQEAGHVLTVNTAKKELIKDVLSFITETKEVF